MARLLPVLLVILGLAAGAGAGLLLRPAHAPPEATEDQAEPAHRPQPKTEAPDSSVEFVKLNNQFVVPVVRAGRVVSLVVLSLSLEVTQGERANVYQMEPKLRDAILQVLFDHANSGGFQDVFTASSNMSALRLALLEVAQKTLGDRVRDVLIIDIVRQDS